MSYGHADALAVPCTAPACTRHAAAITDDGRLLCTAHYLKEHTMARSTLADVAARESREGRLAVHAYALEVAHRLGLPLAPFARPAVNAGLTRCPGCGCNIIPGRHRPGSEDCRDAARDRAATRAG